MERMQDWTQNTDIAHIQPLRGMRVLSLAQLLPGPFAGMLLTELGAEVILVEQPEFGDPARRIPEFFATFARGKKSVILDLKTPKGVADFMRLAATARVVLEGFRPGVAQRLGVGFESVRLHRRDVIYCSISGYGQDADERLLPGHDLSYQARAGAVDPSGECEPAYPAADLSAAMYAALAVAAAAHSPHSCYLDLSLTDAALSWRMPVAAQGGVPAQGGTSARGGASARGCEPEEANGSDKASGSERAGGSSQADASECRPVAERTRPAYGIFTTADGHISLSIMHEDAYWRHLCAVLELNDAAHLNVMERAARAEELHTQVAAALATWPTEAVLAKLSAAGVAVGRVNDDVSLWGDPLFVGRGMVRSADGAGGTGRQIRTPFSRMMPEDLPAAPGHGEQTEEILSGLEDDN